MLPMCWRAERRSVREEGRGVDWNTKKRGKIGEKIRENPPPKFEKDGGKRERETRVRVPQREEEEMQR